MDRDANAAQRDYWSSEAGQKWIDHEAVLDAALAPMRDRILELAALPRDAAVLDIGCGTGDLTRAAARRTPEGSATGIDIAPPLIARARAAGGPGNARYRVADAQTEPLAGYSHAVSRLGLMFFQDPVAALANIARALPPGGPLVFAAWGPPAGTLWFSAPKAAAEAHLGPGPAADPHAPGPLAFQDLDRVAGLLAAAGWTDIDPRCEALQLTPGGDVAQAAAVAARVGPAARIVAHHGAGPAQVAAIVRDVATAFAPHAAADGLALPAAVNIVTCRAPAPG